MVDRINESIHNDRERISSVNDVKATKLIENKKIKNKIKIYYLWTLTQARTQSRSSHKPHRTAHLAPRDAQFALITILA